MRNPPRLPRNGLGLLLALLATLPGGAALTPTEWQHRQTVKAVAPGLTKIALSAITLDAAQPDLSDLRLIDAQGQEVAYLLDRDLAVRGLEPVRPLSPRSFRSSPSGDTTQLVFEIGTTAPLESIDLETTVPYFLKAAHVEISSDGNEWKSLGAAVPLFRQFGAEQLRLSLNREKAAFVRVTLDDFRSRKIEFTGARLFAFQNNVEPPPLVPLGAKLTRRDEFANETVLTVTLDGRHVPLAALSFDARDPLFMRRVTVAIREVQGAASAERVIDAGTIYRVSLDGAPARAQLELPLAFSPPTRELLVHIHNGDSPPLTLDGVSAKQHPLNLLFLAPAAGTYSLLSGNPQAAAPRYDLAAFAGEMRKAEAATVTAGDLEAMPDYHPRESLGTAPLPDVPLAGAPLDTAEWREHRALRITRPGVQELELDPAALARCRPDCGDLRLVHTGNQIPYVLERPALFRSLALAPVGVPNAKHPSVSVWRLTLPQPGVPVRRLVLTSATPLFQRQIRIYEKLTDRNGGTYEGTLADAGWSRTPEPGVPETLTVELRDRPQSNTLWIETDNGDNPAIALGAVQAVYPVVRLVFKTTETEGFALALGNQMVNAPRYDLSLVSVKLLTSSRNVAELAPGGSAAAARLVFVGINVGYVFWGALALVVIVLLVVVAKLLPKPPAPK